MELLPIDQTNWREASNILVTDEQLRFVAAHQPVALLILAKALLHVDERVWEPFALSHEASQLCGVVALVFDGRLCEIFHLAIDYRLQGRGYGSLAMTEIVRYATHKRGCDELKLTVHPENEHAQHIYARAGFLRNGQERHGEPVWEFNRR